ncbi:MAG: hypothetical protein IT376_16950 [Polyangiaceae bacterium]|nr:hypothetical protein [Polyangiaceae bacterium]
MSAKPLFAAALAAASLAACSRTTPVVQYPPAGPAGGLPYEPLPSQLAGDDDDDDDDDAPPPAPKAAAAPAPPQASVELPGTVPALARKASCTAPRCPLASWVPDLAFARAGTAELPGALWQHDVAAKSAVGFGRNASIDVVVVVLQGKLTVTGDDKSAPVELEPWQAAYVPGGGVALTATGGAATVLVGVASAKGTLAEAAAMERTQPATARWVTRPAPIAIAKLAEIVPQRWGRGAFAARVAFGKASGQRAALSVLQAGPGAAIAEHAHDAEAELLAIVAGTSATAVAGAAAPAPAGAVLGLAMGTSHSMRVDQQSLTAIQLFAPAGPEGRYAKWAAEEPAP